MRAPVPSHPLQGFQARNTLAGGMPHLQRASIAVVAAGDDSVSQRGIAPC
jgi:hypothetical protein